MENVTPPAFSENPHNTNRIGPTPIPGNKTIVDEPKRTTELEDNLQHYNSNLNRFSDNLVVLSQIAAKLGIHEEVNDKAEEVPGNLLSQFQFQNYRLSGINDLMERYLASLRDAI